MSDEMKVATEVAEAEFERFLEAMDIDVEAAAADAEEREDIARARRRIVRAIEMGRMVIDDEGRPVFKTSSGQELTFNEPTGASKIAMSRAMERKGGSRVSGVHAFLADIAGVNANVFAKMPERDLNVCEALSIAFLT